MAAGRADGGAIGSRLHLESGTLTPLLKRLQAAGYVRRSRDPGDDRLVRTELTAAGRALEARAAFIPHAMEQAIGLPSERVAALRAALDDLRSRLAAAA